MEPVRGYVRSGGVDIAYHVFGEGPPDVVWSVPFGNPLELGWELPAVAHWWMRVAAFARCWVYDQRGVGASDRDVGVPTLDEHVSDLAAVAEATGAGQVALAASSQGAAQAIAYAGRHPGRVSKLVLYAATARGLEDADYPEGRSLDEARAVRDRMVSAWGTGDILELTAPSVAGDPTVRAWWARGERTLASPGLVRRAMQAFGGVDVREEARTLRVPTLVVHRTDDAMVPVGQGRWLAANIPGARFVELPGADHPPYFGDAEALAGEIEEFLTGRRSTRPERLLTTLLFTDIAGSTERAAELGDAAWRDLLERHHTAVRRQLARFGGQELTTAGDAFLAHFPSASAAVIAARGIREALTPLGLRVRTALHTTECERIGDTVGGLGVHVVARIAAAAEPGDILASGTVGDVLTGSGVRFDDRGERELRGVPGRWRLLAVGHDTAQAG